MIQDVASHAEDTSSMPQDIAPTMEERSSDAEPRFLFAGHGFREQGAKF